MNDKSSPAQVDVAALRKSIGWTQEQLAEWLGVERSTVSRWETGSPVKGPAIRLMERLVEETAKEKPAAAAE